MLKAFLHLLDTRFSFLKETPLLLAVSGGIDSMVLIDLCQKSALNISLALCAHSWIIFGCVPLKRLMID